MSFGHSPGAQLQPLELKGHQLVVHSADEDHQAVVLGAHRLAAVNGQPAPLGGIPLGEVKAGAICRGYKSVIHTMYFLLNKINKMYKN